LLNAKPVFKKRNHVELMVLQKLSQNELILNCQFDYKTVISKSTMSDILKPDYKRKLNQLESVEKYNKRVRDLYLDLEKYSNLFLIS
jgi:hypothetical protein